MKNPTELKIWQAAFDGVMAQGALAQDNTGCHYRLGNFKCGVGHLMTDAEAIRASGWCIDNAIASGCAPKWMNGFCSFLQDIQIAHDLAINLEGFARNMNAIKPGATS